MSLLSLFGWRRKKPVAPVEDSYDTERETEKPKPEQVESVRLAVDGKKTYNTSPTHKHDPLYNKKAYKAARAARRRMGLE